MSTMLWVAAGVFLGLFVFALMRKLVKLAFVTGLMLFVAGLAWTTMRGAADPMTAARMDDAAESLGRKTGEAARKAADAARPVAERAAHAAKKTTAEVASKVGEAVADRVVEEFSRGFGGDDDDSAQTEATTPSPAVAPEAGSPGTKAKATGR